VNNQHHLMLRLARLKAADEQEQKGDHLTFLFARGGSGKYVSKSATHRLSSGDIVVFNCASGPKLSVFDKTAEFLFWSFSVCFENLLPLFAGSEVSLLREITESFKNGKVYPGNSPLAAECHRLLAVVPSQYNLDHRGQLLRIAASVLSAEFKDAFSQKRGQVKSDDHMIQVFEKLSSSELINLSVGELAERFSCSRRHLNRLFHQHFGVSVASLRMEMRLLKAISLLRDANAKVINVAEECGFNHLGLFNTCFKRRFGNSPGQWRKTALRSDGPKSKLPGGTVRCPLENGGMCPMSGQFGAISPSATVSCADKITDGDALLEDLDNRSLILGAQNQSNNKCQSNEPRSNA
jgi:AraC-like DNA-binding protein